MPDTSPLTRKLFANVPAATAAAAQDQPLGEAPFAGTVTDASFTPKAAMVGDNVNTRTVTVINKGQTGAGATVVGTLAFTAGVNGVAYDEKQLTLSGVAGATTVADGDILAVVETVGGTGLANPGGLAQVELTRG